MSSIQYNSFDLQTSNIITEKVSHTGTPEKDLVLYRNARRNGSVITSDYWVQKAINISGHIIGSSVADLDAKIDEFKQELTAGESLDLDIGYNSGTRRYLATTKQITLDRERFNTYWIPFAIEFACADPFGRDTSLTTQSLNNQTSSPFSLPFVMGGSVPSLPAIKVTFDSASSITAIKIENVTTGDDITITRAFSTAEVLSVNCEDLAVDVDGTEVDYSGVFPSFVIGSNNIRVTITGSSFQADLVVEYYNFYL